MSADPFPVLAAAAEEIWRDARYQWDNATRADSGYCVVQRTLSGAVEFEMDGATALAGANQAILFTHQEQSAYRYPAGATEPYRLQFVAFAPGALLPFLISIRQEFGSVVKMQAEGEAARLLAEILRRSRQRDFRDSQHLTEILCRLLLCVHREQVVSKQTEDPIEYGYYLLNDNAAGQLSIKEIARLAGVSREYFIREYARRYQATPGATLRRLRLERARAMLLATSMSLTDVAAACGFGGPDTFRRSFRQHFGKNPLELRKARGATAL